MRVCVTVLAASLLAAATGCSGSGELANGTFHYVCTTSHDYTCSERAGFYDFHQPLAVGGTFELEYTRHVSDIMADQHLAGVRPASPQVAEEVSSATQHGMRFIAPGEGAFLAHGADGSVMDFIHLRAAEVASVELEQNRSHVDAMTMTAGQSVSISAYPLGEDGDALAGSMLCNWTSDDPTIAAVPPGTLSCSIVVDALTSGDTTLRVSINQVPTELQVTVEEGTP